MAAQQQMIQQRTQQQHVQARQAMLAQQQFNGGVPMNMPNGMNPGMNMNATAQFAQMRGQPGPRPPVGVPLPGHLQQLQQEATHQSQQQAQQAQLHQQQQQHQVLFWLHSLRDRGTNYIQQQLLAMQMQSAAHGGQPGPNQMNSQQMQNLRQMAVVQQQQQAHLQQQQQQAQQAQQQAQANQQQAQQQAHEQQQQQAQHQQQVSQEQAAAAVAARQSQVQAQQQQNQANPQTSQPQGPQQVISQAQQQAMNPAMMRMRMAQQQQQQQQMQMQQKLPSILRLHAFADNLGQYINSSSKPPTDLSYWMNFVAEFFSPSGIFRPVLWMAEEAKSKQYEISYPAIARYFNTHFDSGVTNMQLIVQAAVERPLGDGATHISSEKSSFIYWFENKSQVCIALT